MQASALTVCERLSANFHRNAGPVQSAEGYKTSDPVNETSTQFGQDQSLEAIVRVSAKAAPANGAKMIKRLFRSGFDKKQTEGDFASDEKGSVAVEFALTAIPFFVLLFAILEAGIVFFATATLDQAVNDAGRLIRTGQAQTAGVTEQQLTQTICDNVVLLSGCTSNLKIDVRVYSNFSSVAFPSVLGTDGTVQADKLAFSMGNAGDIVLVRAFYVWPIWSPFPTGIANNGGTSSPTRLIQSSIAFRNEPFTS